MTSFNTPDMLEATRLAREGRLAEASALLQRLFRGEATPDAGPSAPAGTAPAAAAGTWPAAGMAAPQMPEALRGFLEQLNQGGLEQPGISDLPGLGGLPGLSPAHAPDPVPEGAQFTTRSFANEVGSPRLQALQSRARSAKGSRRRWWSCCTAAPSRPTTSPPAPR
jgi:hypothetical protein